MGKWVVTVECADIREAVETAAWLNETYGCPTVAEWRD